MPRLNFRFLRDTPNFRMFIAEDPDGSGVPYNVYFPKEVLTGVVAFEGIISRENTRGRGVFLDGYIEHAPTPEPLRCCYRDNDGDGNCKVHSAPGVYRESYLRRHPECPRPFKFGGAPLAPSLQERVTTLEERQSLLFQAVEKIIKLLEPTRALMKRVFR